MEEDINHFVNVRQPQCLLNEGDLRFLLSEASIASLASPELGTAQPQLDFYLFPLNMHHLAELLLIVYSYICDQRSF